MVLSIRADFFHRPSSFPFQVLIKPSSEIHLHWTLHQCHGAHTLITDTLICPDSSLSIHRLPHGLRILLSGFQRDAFAIKRVDDWVLWHTPASPSNRTRPLYMKILLSRFGLRPRRLFLSSNTSSDARNSVFQCNSSLDFVPYTLHTYHACDQLVTILWGPMKWSLASYEAKILLRICTGGCGLSVAYPR